MTTIDFVERKLKKAMAALEVSRKKPNVTPSELENLVEKVKHYQIILDMLLKERDK